jgi:Amidase
MRRREDVRDWPAANETRHRMRWKWAEFFEEWDVLLCPVAASAAFPHDHEGERYQRTIEVNGRRVPTVDQLFWAGLTCMVYLPATVAPVGLTPDDVEMRDGHGSANPFMPIDEAHRLYARAGEPKELLIIPGAKHLEWIGPTSPFHKPYVGRVVEWFRRRLPVAAAA